MVLNLGLRIVLIVVGMALLLVLVKRTVNWFCRLYSGAFLSPAQMKRTDTLTHVVRDVGRVVVLAVGGMVILSEVSVDLKPVQAAAGLGSLAIGLAGKAR